MSVQIIIHVGKFPTSISDEESLGWPWETACAIVLKSWLLTSTLFIDRRKLECVDRSLNSALESHAFQNQNAEESSFNYLICKLCSLYTTCNDCRLINELYSKKCRSPFKAIGGSCELIYDLRLIFIICITWQASPFPAPPLSHIQHLSSWDFFSSMPADSTICFSAKVLPQPSDPEVESQSFCTIKITAPSPGPISKLSSPVVSGWGSDASSFSRSLCICSATTINLEQEVLWWPNRTACGFGQSLDCCGFSFLKKLQTLHPLHIHISIRETQESV